MNNRLTFLRLLCVASFFMLSKQIALSQTTIYSAPQKLNVRQDVRVDATIHNRMSTEEFVLRLSEIRRMQAADDVRRKENCATQAKILYSSFGKYPNLVSNGWYNVTGTDGNVICGEYKVYVEGNKVKKAFYYDRNEQTVVFTSDVAEGKCLIKLFDGNITSDFITLYFFENIISPDTRASEHQEGSVTFWTSYSKLNGAAKVFINGDLVGEFNSYFSHGDPICGQKGTFMYSNKPGHYSYKVGCGKDWWEGEFDLVNNNCELRQLVNE